MKKLKILQVSGTASGGSWFLSQVTELASRGHQVDVVTPGEGPLTDALRQAGFRVEVLPFRGYRPREVPRVLRSFVGLRRAMGGDYDVVHAHLIKSIVMCRAALAGRPVGRRPRLVSQIPGVVHLRAGWLRAIDRLTLRLDDVTVGSCTAFAQEYDALGARHTAVSFYGMDTAGFRERLPERDEALRRELGLGPDDVAVLMVAHMYPTTAAHFQEVGVKGHEVFIDAAATAKARDRRLAFLVVGDEFVGTGAYRRQLEERAERSPGSVRFLGHRDDVPRLLAAADIAANPSLSESASYTMMEASLAGLPVVATSVGGLTDTVVDGVTGIIVPPKDSDALAEAFLTLAADPAGRRRLGEAGREHVTRSFDIARTVDSLEDIYASALARG